MINIAQILSECPKNTKLYSPIFGDVYLYSTSPNYLVISVTLNEGGKSLEQFLCDGKYTQMGECMLFPSKEQRDWSKFQIPFKDGDIIYTKHKLGTEFVSIFQREYERDIITYWDINLSTNKLIGSLHEGNAFKVFIEKDKVKEQRFATEEEKERLFRAIKDNGYQWNAETKTLEKLIQPKFKVGDKVRHKNNHNVVFTIISIEEDSYVCGAELALWFDDQDKYELVPNKFNINTLVPFESRVLVRDRDKDVWRASFWGCLINNRYGYNYDTTRGYSKQCIPYEGNEHLLGKTYDCQDYYKTW